MITRFSLLHEIGTLWERYLELRSRALAKMQTRQYASCEELRSDAREVAMAKRDWKAAAERFKAIS